MGVGKGDSRVPAIPNPYIAGNPIKDRKLFFGREDDFAYIRQKVGGSRKGGLFVLCGTRRSGKTSILFQILGGRLGKDFVPVLIDMQSMTVNNDAEFLARLAQELVAAVDLPEIVYEQDFVVPAAKNPGTAFQHLVEKIDARLQGRKLILMFDEYELIETHLNQGRLTGDILNLLANWTERREGVYVIFTGSHKLESRVRRYWERFLGKALHRRISFLSKGDTLRLIHEPVAGSVTYGAGVAEEIYALTAGQPFYTQVICQTLVDHLNESGKRDVTTKDSQLVADEIVDNPLPQMVFTWSSLTALEKLSLSLIATLSREPGDVVSATDIIEHAAAERIGYRLDQGELQEALERLFHQDLLNKDSSGEGYCFKMDLWRQWVTRMHSLWQVIDEVTRAGRDLGEGIVPLASSSRRRTVLIGAAAIALIVGAGAIYDRVMRRDQNPSAIVPAARDSTLLSVQTQPAAAAVFLGSQWIGRSPIEDAVVPAERLPLRIELAGYKEFIDTLDLSKDEPLKRAVSLEQRCGRLQVTSDPPGARVSLDGGDLLRRSPCLLESLSVMDLHGMELRLTGYETAYFNAIQIREDSTIALHHDFAPTTHPLTVRSDPEGALFYLDGKHRGRTPWVLEAVTQGAHGLEIRKQGFATVHRVLTIPVADNLLEVVLIPLPPGELIFQVVPYADLWIDGTLHEEGAVYYAVALTEGTYEIELRHPHYETVHRVIEVRSGETTTLQHDFGADEEQQ